MLIMDLVVVIHVHVPVYNRQCRHVLMCVLVCVERAGLGLGSIGCDFTHAYDYVFWMGDLNYRIDMPREDVLTHVAARNWVRYVCMFLSLARACVDARAVYEMFVHGLLADLPTRPITHNPFEIDWRAAGASGKGPVAARKGCISLLS